MDKKKVKYVVGGILTSLALGGAVLTGAAVVRHELVSILDRDINHLEEYCPYNDILGVNHQINAINKNDEYVAKLNRRKEIVITTLPVAIENQDMTTYVAPEGYELLARKTLRR